MDQSKSLEVWYSYWFSGFGIQLFDSGPFSHAITRWYSQLVSIAAESFLLQFVRCVTSFGCSMALFTIKMEFRLLIWYGWNSWPPNKYWKIKDSKYWRKKNQYLTLTLFCFPGNFTTIVSSFRSGAPPEEDSCCPRRAIKVFQLMTREA